VRITLTKSLFFSLLSLPLAMSASLAGPCEQLAGNRYLVYLEGTFTGTPNTLVTSFLDFGREHWAYKLLVQPKPVQLPAGGQGVYGTGYIDTMTCTASPTATDQANLSFASGGTLWVKVAPNGASFAAQGVDPNSKFMKGYGYKVQ